MPPGQFFVLGENELPKGSKRGTWQTYAQVMAMWEPMGPIHVRVAVHCGPAQERDGDFFGQTLNRAGRLLAAGHGGQVLLSEASAGLVRDSLLGLSLKDLGEHRLRDLQAPERVAQLVIAPVTQAQVLEVDELSATDRGAGGFGSTGR